jgi:hypothetical protein
MKTIPAQSSRYSLRWLTPCRQKTKMNPSIPLAANNAGYMYHKMGQYEDAVEWFAKRPSPWTPSAQ